MCRVGNTVYGQYSIPVMTLVLYYGCSRYLWLPADRLLDISLPRLAAKGALVAVWVTNKRKLAMFVEHTLFPKWHVHYLTEWHWLKVLCASILLI